MATKITRRTTLGGIVGGVAATGQARSGSPVSARAEREGAGVIHPYAADIVVEHAADISGAVIPASATILRTHRYGAGAASGGAAYTRASKTEILSAAYPAAAYRRSSDRFMPDGSENPDEGGYWRILPDRFGFDVTAFGAILDDNTDGATALNAAAQMARRFQMPLTCPPGKRLYLGAPVDLTGIASIHFEAPIRVDAKIRTIPIEVGGFAAIGSVCNFVFREVTDGTSEYSSSPMRPIMRFIGIKGSNIQVGSCNYIQFYADAGRGFDYSATAYNRVFLDGIQGLVELTDGGGASWVNENSFYRARILRLQIAGVGYAHNNNRFYDPTLEGAEGRLLLRNCHSNSFLGVRGEASERGGVVVKLAADTYSNRLIFSWTGSGTPQDDFRIPPSISDLGQGNVVTTEAATLFDKICLFSISSTSFILSTNDETSASETSIAPSPYGIVETLKLGRAVIDPGFSDFGFDAHRLIVSSELVPVTPGTVLTLDTDFDGALLRPVVTVYDANGALLESEHGGGAYVSFLNMSNFDTKHSAYGVGSNLTAQQINDAPITVRRPDAAFIRLALFAGAPGRARILSGYVFAHKLDRRNAGGMVRPQTQIFSLNGRPVRGYVPVGVIVRDRVSRIFHDNILAYETRVSGRVVAGSKKVTVEQPGPIADGDLVGISMDNGVVHWSTISNLSSASFAIAPVPTGRALPDRARIVFNRWQ